MRCKRKHHHRFIARILLAKEGIDISLENNNGETPFPLSIKENKTKMIRLLLPLLNFP
jgi:hypothetical protein